MHRAMMRATQGHQAVWVVCATFVSGPKMVDVTKRRVSTARKDATSAIPAQYQPPHRRRDVLGCTLELLPHVGVRFGVAFGIRGRRHVERQGRHPHDTGGSIAITGSNRIGQRGGGGSSAHVSTDVTNVLRVAQRHLDDLGSDFNLVPAPLHQPALTAFAHRQSYLVARAAFVGGPLEHPTRHEQQHRVVVERFTSVATDFRKRVPKAREHFTGHLEAEHVPFHPGVASVGGPASMLVT